MAEKKIRRSNLKRIKLFIATVLLAALTFGTAISGIGTGDGNLTAPYGEFDPGSADQSILNGGTIAEDGEATYYSDEDGIHVLAGESDQLISDDSAENINVYDNTLYYTVAEGESSQIKTLDLSTGEESEVIGLSSGIDQMYLVNGDYICYSTDGSVYQLEMETGDSELMETSGEVFNFLPTEYGIVYAVGDLFDIDIYAGDTLVTENAESYYTDEGYILLETDGEQYQVNIQDAFNGGGNLETVSLYETIELSDIIHEHDDCEECEANYEAFIDGDISLGAYQLQEAPSGNAKTLSAGQENVILRARQQAEIKWTPLASVKGWKGEYTFEPGTTYYGIPYGQPVNSGYYTPYNATFSTFSAAVKNASSEFYTSSSSYGSKTSTYYASDCSAFVSWAWGISNRQTTHTLNSRGSVITDWTTYVMQVGDILNLSGSHVVLISDILYDSKGAVSSIEIMEQTPPICKVTRYGVGGNKSLADLTSYYSSYTLVRHKNIDGVAYKYDDNIPLEESRNGTFLDVTVDKWYYDAVEYVFKNGLFNGTSANTFTPESAMSRGQMVTVLGRISEIDGDTYSYTGTITGTSVNLRSGPGTSYSSAGKLTAGNKVTVTERSGSWVKVEYGGLTGYVKSDYIVGTFSDVSTGEYYIGYIEWAQKAGLVEGYSSKQFGPNDSLTREQMCTILCRYAEYCDITLEKAVSAIAFSDESSISNYAKEYVKALQMSGIINGVGDNKFAPQGTCTRAQVAAMLMRYHESYVAEEEQDIEDPEEEEQGDGDERKGDEQEDRETAQDVS